MRLGVAMRGVVDNPDLVSMTGTNPVAVRRWAWIIGTIFASMAGLLFAPSLSLNAEIITLLIVQAFGAAAIGYFSNLPLTFVGGLFIGVAGALATKYAASVSWLTGLSARAALRHLVHRAHRHPAGPPGRAPGGGGHGPAPQLVRPDQGPPRRRPALALVFFCFVPSFVGVNLSTWSSALVYIMLFLSLGLLVKTSGQISLCHLAFAAVGAAAFGHFTTSFHLPWALALLLAGLVAVPVGAIVAIPAIRLSGVFLALATYGFGILLEQMFYDTNLMFGPTTGGIAAPRPDVTILGWHLYTDKGFYYLLLAFVVLTVVVIQAILRGRMGRLLKGLSDSPGRPRDPRGDGQRHEGAGLLHHRPAWPPSPGPSWPACSAMGSGTNYSSFASLTMVAILTITVVGDPWYAILAALAYGIVPGYITVANINTYLTIIFGVSAATFALQANRALPVPAPHPQLLGPPRAAGPPRWRSPKARWTNW